MRSERGMIGAWIGAVLAAWVPSHAYAACQMIMPGDAGGKANTIIFKGCNIEINNGSGTTATVNGLGNLTVGYNESRGSGHDQRGGSHNVVVGSRHNFSGYGGLVVGYENETSGTYATVNGGSENVARRREASTLLKTYLDQQAALSPGKHYLVGGDWNDVITPTSSTANSFPDLLADPNSYKFLDMALAGRTDLASYSRSLIDHLMVNKAACETFSAGRITTLRLDLVTDYYSAYISDHRPVMVQVPVFQ